MPPECDFLRRDVVIGARAYINICAGCKIKAGIWSETLVALLTSASLHRIRCLINLQISRKAVLWSLINSLLLSLPPIAQLMLALGIE